VPSFKLSTRWDKPARSSRRRHADGAALAESHRLGFVRSPLPPCPVSPPHQAPCARAPSGLFHDPAGDRCTMSARRRGCRALLVAPRLLPEAWLHALFLQPCSSAPAALSPLDVAFAGIFPAPPQSRTRCRGSSLPACPRPRAAAHPAAPCRESVPMEPGVCAQGVLPCTPAPLTSPLPCPASSHRRTNSFRSPRRGGEGWRSRQPRSWQTEPPNCPGQLPASSHAVGTLVFAAQELDFPQAMGEEKETHRCC